MATKQKSMSVTEFKQAEVLAKLDGKKLMRCCDGFLIRNHSEDLSGRFFTWGNIILIPCLIHLEAILNEHHYLTEITL